MPKHQINHTVEDYLRAAYRVEEREGKVTTASLAAEMGVSAASASEMLQKLAAMKLLTYRKYQGATLTKKGTEEAVIVTRRHRLWEVFLIKHLAFEWDQVHALADKLEHIRSDELIDRLDDFLGNPTHDPHGDPIPTREGSIASRQLVAIAAMKPEDQGSVQRVIDEQPELLRYAASLGLRIGAKIRVIEHIVFDGSVRLEADGRESMVSRKLAESVFVDSRVGDNR